MPIAQTAEQLALAGAVRQWTERSGAIAAVRDREPAAAELGTGELGTDQLGTDQPLALSSRDALKTEHWSGLIELGIFSIAVPADLGGAGGSVADLAVAVEQLAAALIPGPVLPTLVACLVLARSPSAGARSLLADLAAGLASVAVAWPGSPQPARLPA